MRPEIAVYWARLSTRPGYLNAKAAQQAALAAQNTMPTAFGSTTA